MALLKLLFILLVIIIALNKKIKAGNIFIFAAILLGFIFNLSVKDLFLALINSATAHHTISLTLLVFMLLVLSESMFEFGNLERMLGYAKRSIKNFRLRLIIFPALICLLPMPGGAIFSAPMVKELTKDCDYTPRQLSYINYWFRHIWEYWWPLYPGILLMLSITGISMNNFVLVAFPLSFFALLFGFIYFPATSENEKMKIVDEKKDKVFLLFLKELTPILIAIIGGFSLGAIFASLFPKFIVAREMGLGIAILSASIFIWLTAKKDINKVRKCIFSKHCIKMAYTAFGIMIFKGLLDESQAVHAVVQDLLHYNIPLLGVCMILPFISGVITGISIGYVGTSFPILIGLLRAVVPESEILPYIVLCVVFGFVGTLVSPLHICLIMSNEFFNAKQSAVFRYLYLPCFGMLCVGFCYFLILRMFY